VLPVKSSAADRKVVSLEASWREARIPVKPGNLDVCGRQGRVNQVSLQNRAAEETLKDAS
jgi:hypothetical protein